MSARYAGVPRPQLDTWADRCHGKADQRIRTPFEAGAGSVACGDARPANGLRRAREAA